MEFESNKLTEISKEITVDDDLKPIKVEKMEIEEEVFSDLPIPADLQDPVKKERVVEDVKIKSEIPEISEFKEELDIEDERYIVNSPDKEYVEYIKIENEVLETSKLKKDKDTEDDEKRVVKTFNKEQTVQYMEQNGKLETDFDDCCSLCICFKLNSDGSHYATSAEFNKNEEPMSISDTKYFHLCDDYCIKSKPTSLDKSTMNVEAHYQHSTGECSYKCRKCYNAMAGMGQWESMIQTKHLTVRTKLQDSLYKCNECHKTFVESGQLNNHERRVHAKDHSYKCNECHKGFFSKKYVRQHVKIHTREYPHKCSECNKGFHSPCILKDHMNTHTGDRSYKCNECHKGFFSKDAIKRHVRIHTGEYPYKCNECHYGVSSKGAIRRHVRIHTG